MSEYASKHLGLRRPPLLLSIMQVAGGGMILILVLLGLFQNYSLFKETYPFGSSLLRNAELDHSGMTYIHSRAFILASAIFLIIFLPSLLRVIVKGLKWLVSGFSEIVTPWIPSNIPEAFRDYAEVEKGFKDRTLSIYKPFEPFISGIFGGKSLFITPTRRKIVEENGTELRNRAKRFVFAALGLGAVLFFFHWLTTESAQEFLMDADLEWVLYWIDDAISGAMRLPFILLILLQGALAAIEYISTLMLMPRYQPSTVALEGTKHYRGFGHPDLIFSRLPDLAQSLRWEGFLNRVDSTWGERASAAVGDVGEFSGRIIIEQQPKPLDNMGDRPAYLMAFFGWILMFVGIFLYLFQLLPAYIRQGDFNFFYLPLYVPIMGLAASIAARSGDRFIGYGRTLLHSAQFRSLGILIQIGGTLSRADIRVGKSIADSIESTNVVVRSDFSARFWSAELLSEASRLDAKRELLALEQSDQSHTWIQFFRDGIENLREEGVRPIGVDLQAKEIDELLKANISISALRSSAMEKAQLTAAASGDETPLLTGSSEAESAREDEPLSRWSISDANEYKECPECAEMVRAKAKKCRFCGYRFE